MKRVLLYTWGVFLAAFAGIATLSGMEMVLKYVDMRILDILQHFVPDRDYVSMLSIFDTTRSFVTSGSLKIVALAVTVWTFERWRQHKTQAERRS